MSSIVTFYSYKGGVGRTMALANVAVLLAQMGKRVLMVDWDLEAPGLQKYFSNYGKYENNRGLLELLIESKDCKSLQEMRWTEYMSRIEFDGSSDLYLMTSGVLDKNYNGKVLDFNWEDFFEVHNGGDVIEHLRNAWKESFDFVLIDSRTGITDSGGICTVQLPDILAILFTSNHQSLYGAKEIALEAQKGRQLLAFDRMPLTILPIPSRFDSRTEFKESQRWLHLFARELELFYADWLPKKNKPIHIIERNKLPHVAFFSFGEKLPVLLEGTSDPESLGRAYLTNAEILCQNLHYKDREPESLNLTVPPKAIRKVIKAKIFLEKSTKKISRQLFGISIGVLSALITAVLLKYLPSSTPVVQIEIKIDGSSTVSPITNLVVREYDKEIDPLQRFETDISGTSGGFKRFCSGETDINNASRLISEEEANECQSNNVRFLAIPIGFDAVTIVVNNENDWIEEIRLSQLKELWSPKAENVINRWNQIDDNISENREIKLYGPGGESGTFDYFTRYVIREEGQSRTDYSASEDDYDLVKGVSRDINSLGYFGYPYYEDNSSQLKALAVVDDIYTNGAEEPVKPSRESVYNNSYPLSRKLYIYVNTDRARENENIESFIQFYLEEASQLVGQANSIPLTNDEEYIKGLDYFRTELKTNKP